MGHIVATGIADVLIVRVIGQIRKGLVKKRIGIVRERRKKPSRRMNRLTEIENELAKKPNHDIAKISKDMKRQIGLEKETKKDLAKRSNPDVGRISGVAKTGHNALVS